MEIDLEQALRFMGYSGQPLTDELKERLAQMAVTCKDITKASFVWKAFDIDLQASSESRVVLKDCPLVLEGTSIAKHLEGATKAVLFAATLGLANERELRALTSVNSLDALLFSACSNALIEQVAECAQQTVCDWAKVQNLFGKMRFSPGYGDLPLAIQPAFLNTLTAQKTIGLNVSETNLLIPTKSITAIVGLFDKQPDKTYAPCTDCVACEFCSYREKGLICHG